MRSSPIEFPLMRAISMIDKWSRMKYHISTGREIMLRCNCIDFRIESRCSEIIVEGTFCFFNMVYDVAIE